AIFCTGRRAELPPRPEAPARFFREVARHARRALKDEEIRVVGRSRIREGSPTPDEVRLALAPRKAIAGFTSIEVGVVYAPGAGGPIGLPEGLLRLAAGSACGAATAGLGRRGRGTRGRRTGDRRVGRSWERSCGLSRRGCPRRG